MRIAVEVFAAIGLICTAVSAAIIVVVLATAALEYGGPRVRHIGARRPEGQ